MTYHSSKTTVKKSHSIEKYTQGQLKELEKLAGQNLEKIVYACGFDLKERYDRYVGKCPIHDGDNISAFNIYKEGHSQAGNWICYTHGCERHFLPTVIGLVRAHLSKIKYGYDIDRRTGDNQKCSMNEAIHWIEKIIGQRIDELKTDDEHTDKAQFCKQIRMLAPKNEDVLLNVSVDKIKSYIKVPSAYFKGRGYSDEVLLKYLVGDCYSKDKEMYNRAVVPILDHSGQYMIGCTGRSIYDECPHCNLYHDHNETCPLDGWAWKFTKWRHNKGFRAEKYLYNLWSAKDIIRECGWMILTESPGNVWRLEEAGIHNSVATFGAHLTDHQKYLIDASGALHLILLNDGDAAGKAANIQIKRMCQLSYGVKEVPLDDGMDIGAMSIEQVKTIVERTKREIGI